MAEALKQDEKLDDVMLAMDVVDTLRHERLMVAKDLDVDRRGNLVARLRGIYKAQGIEVPDSVLMEGVLALEDKRFQFEPAKPGFGTKLARLYIRRRKWLPLLYTLGFIIGSAFAINYVGFVRPQTLAVQKTERLLTKTLPEQLSDAHGKALDLAATDDLKARTEALYAEGEIAITNGDVAGAQKASQNLQRLAADLAQSYDIRIVSRPGEYSGVFRINDDGGDEVRNYYLIVEGISASGELLTVLINSEEDQKSKRTNIWGVRVTETVFNAVAADKKDDRIIQNAIIGQKKRGHITPDYTVKSSGGLILDW